MAFRKVQLLHAHRLLLICRKTLILKISSILQITYNFIIGLSLAIYRKVIYRRQKSLSFGALNWRVANSIMPWRPMRLRSIGKSSLPT